MSVITTSSTSTKTVKTTVSSEVQVVDLTGTGAAEAFAELVQVREAKSALEKREEELKAALVELTGWAADETKAVAVIDGTEVFKKQIGKSTGIDRKILKESFPAAFDATYWEKPNFTFRAV